MTSKIFWNAFNLHNLTFEKILYAHPLTFDLTTKSFSVDNWNCRKYIPFIFSYFLIVLYFLLSCFAALLGAFKHVPLHYALLNMCIAAVCWNLLFSSITFLTTPGQTLFEALNALLKEDINNKMASYPSNVQPSVKSKKPGLRNEIHKLLSTTNSKGTDKFISSLNHLTELLLKKILSFRNQQYNTQLLCCFIFQWRPVYWSCSGTNKH